MGQNIVNVESELLGHQRTAERKKKKTLGTKEIALVSFIYVPHSKWINNLKMYIEDQKGVDCNLQRVGKKEKVAVQIKLIQKSKDGWLKPKKIQLG